MENKLISVDFYSRFGFLKKPDINEDIYLTYNSLHKPALLGILGAIIGLGGFSQSHKSNNPSFPEYYLKLNHLKAGIQPLGSAKGNFLKTIITYNNSVGYASEELGGNLIIKEQTIINPAYRVYLLLDLEDEIENRLYDYLLSGQAEYIPYLGKNEYQLSWDRQNIIEYAHENFNFQGKFVIENLFIKNDLLKTIRTRNKTPRLMPDAVQFYSFFERLPNGYDQKIRNYNYEEYVLTNMEIPSEFFVDNLYRLFPLGSANLREIIIQLN